MYIHVVVKLIVYWLINYSPFIWSEVLLHLSQDTAIRS
jgi:hypothetical protein